ncbi:PRC-barrel domain-containing protein [Ciceribacter sp. L1K23]|uniref:PRC-barrel domain-containing protein n=1 Tax=Ciceribacter sp. L1K23 TaxID=2820276 RepID=UPI001B830942|nr:PRC-barrel domain-containing protein [Ciceribacter sp. L1K23]MBR0556567.1 PRC-barrel domain-containing protein [Ciceribacter sp. L1K23]
MKMIYVAALMAGTALAPAAAVAQQTPDAGTTQNNDSRYPSQTGQVDAGMNEVQRNIQRALQAFDNNDLESARQAVREARRGLSQQAQNGADAGNNAMNGIRQPLRQAEQALAQRDPERAEQALERVERQMANMDRQRQGSNQSNGQTGSDVVIEDEASIRVDVPEPDVTVRQSSPQVAVQQQQPEIIIHQPAPVVTVEIPQPQVTVRMREPDVNVSRSQPQVEVEQGQPEVRVSDSEPQVRTQDGQQEQANVELQRSGEPVVRMQGTEQQPNVRYTTEQAEVRVNRAEGEPQIRYEQQNQEQANAAANRQAAADRLARNEAGDEIDGQNTAAVRQGDTREDANTAVGRGSTRDVRLTVADIKDYDIVGANGNELGDIEDVVYVDNRLYAVVTSGGFLGLGEDRAAVALSALNVTDEETLEAPNVTERQIDGMANFDSSRYSALPDDHPVILGAR